MAVSIFRSDPNGPVASPSYPDLKGFFTVTYEGAVLETRERNGYDDSDFYALVWDDATGTIKEVEYATTRGWTYLNGASVDATPDVIAKANAYAASVRLADLKHAAAADARKVAKGKTVKVVKGRKVPKGTVGEVFWVGPGKKFSYYDRPADRIGLRTADGTVYWTAASNLEVVDPEDYLADLGDLEARAAHADWTYLVGRGSALMGMAVMR